MQKAHDIATPSFYLQNLYFWNVLSRKSKSIAISNDCINKNIRLFVGIYFLLIVKLKCLGFEIQEIYIKCEMCYLLKIKQIVTMFER